MGVLGSPNEDRSGQLLSAAETVKHGSDALAVLDLHELLPFHLHQVGQQSKSPCLCLWHILYWQYLSHPPGAEQLRLVKPSSFPQIWPTI